MNRYYIKITKEEIDLSEFNSIDIAYIELDDNGYSLRELGFDKDNTLVHKYPSDIFKYGKYGVFDLTLFEISNLCSDLDGVEFERMWNFEK